MRMDAQNAKKKAPVSEMGTILLMFLIPFLLIFVYTGMKVEVSLLKRKIRIANLEKEELVRSNDSLKRKLAEISGNNVEQIYWEKHGILPFYIKNRVVNVRLDSNHDLKDPIGSDNLKAK